MSKHHHDHHDKPGHHQFGTPMAEQRGVHSQMAPLSVGSGFQPLPPPTGAAPYRLDLASIIPDQVAAMRSSGGMCMHLIADTGGVLDPTPQELVAAGMITDAAIAGTYGKPAFAYHCGDVIYFDGQASRYYAQFYLPYEFYPLPILGIPGNHDGDIYDNGVVVDTVPSLTAFVNNFCAATAGTHTPEAMDIPRTAMTQPNVYFTLDTPFATFIGLYTNVPEGGEVQQDQRDWFAGELKAAAPDKPIIVAMHHPIHSLDAFHSGSATMAAVLAEAEAAAGVSAHMVFAGHVHNYQRFTETDAAGNQKPFIVAGFGGYHNLHRMARVNGQDIVAPFTPPDEPNVTLEAFVDDRFGFLRLDIDGEIIRVKSYSVPRPQESYRAPPRLRDTMALNWKTRRLIS
ncbi:metallophosphoesterase family protein [Acidiphilium sp.]|uniref:metallophosphoesterase family protein n=1 Tax=Acidiphilium sp. TaxID=527 RepID=UPI003D068472